jgi:hypothetical protein
MVVLTAACRGQVSGGASDGGADTGGQDSGACSDFATSPCVPDDSLGCQNGAEGFACIPCADPETFDTTLSCTNPVMDPNSGDNDYCCFTYDGGTACVPDPDLLCPGLTSYAYRCTPGVDPATLDALLTCDKGDPDPDGVHDDYCCTRAASGSDGGIPVGCTADAAVQCTGGATGYSCPPGDNPEDNGDVACTFPTTGTDGSDDYCCFPWSYGDSTCTPDDYLTADCPDASSYGFQCAQGQMPSSLVSTLTCGDGLADPDGTDTDYCCTYD